MAVFNLNGFTAEAEVLGKLRNVMFEGGGTAAKGTLSIYGLDLAEAKHVLDCVGIGLAATGLDGEVVQHATTSVRTRTDKPNEANAPRTETLPEVSSDTPAKTVAAGEKAKKAKAKKSKPKPAEAPVKAAPEDQTNVVDLKEKRKEAGGDLAERVAGAKKLIDVVTTLHEAGFQDPDALIAECERIKADVPVLKRIANIADRVKRVLERISA